MHNIHRAYIGRFFKTFNPDNPTPRHSRARGNPVDKKSPRSGSISRFCPLCGVYNSLDSRIRENDGAWDYLGLTVKGE